MSDNQEKPVAGKRRFRRYGCGCLVVLLVALLGAGGYFLLGPKTYTATAWVQMFERKPYFIYQKEMDVALERFVATQFALIRSPLIIDKVVEDPSISKLPILAKQRNREDWLARKLKLRHQRKSEYVTISISTGDPAASEKIVNAVIDTYFEYCETQSQDWSSRLIRQLNLELNRQRSAQRLLRDEIREGEFQRSQQTSRDEQGNERCLREIDTSFAEEALERINGVIDKISDRVVAIQTELNAPSRVQLRKKATKPTVSDQYIFLCRVFGL